MAMKGTLCLKFFNSQEFSSGRNWDQKQRERRNASRKEGHPALYFSLRSYVHGGMISLKGQPAAIWKLRNWNLALAKYTDWSAV